MTAITTAPELTADAYAAKLFGAVLGAFETLSVYAGDRLGWFTSLATDGPATSAELAQRTGSHERYCREWLELQASYGTLTVDATASPSERRFTLPAGPAEVLTDEHSLAFLGALPRMIGAVGPQLPALLQAYRSGGGVSWDEFGDDAREAQSALNRPWFESQLAPALNGCDEVREILERTRRPGRRCRVRHRLVDDLAGQGVSGGPLRRVRRRPAVDRPCSRGGRGGRSRRPGEFPARRGRDIGRAGSVRRCLRHRMPARHAAPGRGAVGDPGQRAARRTRGRGRRGGGR